MDCKVADIFLDVTCCFILYINLGQSYIGKHFKVVLGAKLHSFVDILK